MKCVKDKQRINTTESTERERERKRELIGKKLFGIGQNQMVYGVVVAFAESAVLLSCD